MSGFSWVVCPLLEMRNRLLIKSHVLKIRGVVDLQIAVSSRRTKDCYTPKSRWRPLQSPVQTSIVVYQYFSKCVQLNTNFSKSSGIRTR